jgi:NAD(P)-dependent dehydrogenase (short-subunit alcohol dehydrogenase family)
VGTYVITGSASGIGRATRSRLEQAGHSVLGVDLRDAEVIADLAQVDTRRTAVDDVLARCGGRLDGLVTAAGVGPPFDPATMVSINYFGSEAFLTALRPALAASGSAQVVAVSSNSTTAQPNVPADLVDVCLSGDEDAARALAAKHGDGTTYAASKTAIARYVRRNAPSGDWAGSGVRLNAIAPGATLTPLLQSGLDSDDFGPLIRAFPVPTGGFGTPEQIAFWIDMLLTGEGAPFVCGAIFFVDGGTDAMVRPDAWPTTYTLE